MICVVDCSFLAATFLPEHHSVKVSRFFSHLAANDQLWAPPLIWYEIASVLATNQRKGRISRADSGHILSIVESYRVETDVSIGIHHTGLLNRTATEHDLTVYDAAYLELALRKKALILDHIFSMGFKSGE